jgi:hypothetical protein
MDNLAPDEAGERLARIRPCQLRANWSGKITKGFQWLVQDARAAARRRARTAEH